MEPYSSYIAQRVVLLDSLSCSREVWQLVRFLDMAITEGSGIRKQDGERVVTAVSRGVSCVSTV